MSNLTPKLAVAVDLMSQGQLSLWWLKLTLEPAAAVGEGA